MLMVEYQTRFFRALIEEMSQLRKMSISQPKREILTYLDRQPFSNIQQIAQALNSSEVTIQQHVREMKALDIIDVSKQGKKYTYFVFQESKED